MDADAEGFVFGLAEYGVREMRGWRISEGGGAWRFWGKCGDGRVCGIGGEEGEEGVWGFVCGGGWEGGLVIRMVDAAFVVVCGCFDIGLGRRGEGLRR